MSNEEMELFNTQTEMIIVGSLWSNTETFAFDYIDIINNKDFSDSACRFFHELLNRYISEYSTEVTEQKVNMYVSQNNNVFKGYKKYGGFKTILEFMKYSVSFSDEMKRQVDVLKKWSVLRALHTDGYDVSKILEHKKFNVLSAEQTAGLIRGRIDSICNGTLSNIDDPVLLTNGAIGIADMYLEAPERGYNFPFDFMNREFNGAVRSDVFGLAAYSNSGKGRLLTNILAHMSCCEDLDVALIANEMSEKSMKDALYTTIFNATKIKNLHGEDLELPQKRFVTGLYKDCNGDFIRRKVDINGEWSESIENFKKRVFSESAEYRSVINVLKWYEERQKQGKGLFWFKCLTSGYTDDIVARTARQLVLSKKVDVWSYDTCKHASDSQIDKWGDLVKTVSILSELNKSLNSYAILTLQLNNGALERPIENIDSSNLANASYLFQLLDQLAVFKHFEKPDYENYMIRTKERGYELDESQKYSCIKVLKNRRGEKHMYLLRTNLNLNTWEEDTPGSILLPRTKKKKKTDDAW